jgi:hypothetical protein
MTGLGQGTTFGRAVRIATRWALALEVICSELCRLPEREFLGALCRLHDRLD